MSTKGKISCYTYNSGATPAIYSMTYDRYGNLTRLTRPENHRGQRMWHQYTYDDIYHNLITKINDAYGYASSTSYDPLWNTPAMTIDVNGQRMEFTYDNLGRPSTVRAPYEIASGRPFTIKHEYFPAERKARTIHYAPEGNIETYTFADSLGRAVQTKRTGVVWNGSANAKVSIVSGRTLVDAFGRNIETYYPTTESFGNLGTYSQATGDRQATTEYDTHDRAVSMTLADGSETTSEYFITQHAGDPMLLTVVTDALGRCVR